jgi:hypothetical protein
VEDTIVISLIQQDPTFKKMTPDDVLGKITNHKMLVEEANHVKNLSKGITSSWKLDIALKASKKSKKKQIVMRAQVRKKKKNKMMMMMKKWLSSLRTTPSSWLREELSRETKEKI